MANQSILVEAQPFKYIYGLVISNNSSDPDTKIDISAGICRDSDNVMDIVVAESMTIDSATIGYNGIDVGPVAVNTLYAIYAIASSSNKNPPGFIMTLASNSVPTRPAGYDCSRLVGFNQTNNFAQFYRFSITSAPNSNIRYVQFQDTIALDITGGGISDEYIAMDASFAIPPSNFGKAKCYALWTPHAAGNILYLQATGTSLSETYFKNTAVGTASQDTTVDINPIVVDGAREISYRVSTSQAELTEFTIMGYDLIL